MINKLKIIIVSIILIGINASLNAQANKEALTISEQGSFMIGGRVYTHPGTYGDPFSPDGQTIHGDHAYVFYQKPVKPRKLPLVFWHGIYQSAKTWESTPDGREGFQNIFLRRGFSTYLLDQPRRGKAGLTSKAAPSTPVANEQFWFNRFRIGIYPNYYKGVQFDTSAETLDQFYRQATPNTADFDFEANTDAAVKLFEKLGGGIMVCHSHGGAHTWLTIPKTDKIKAVVAYEPGGNFSFPDDEPRPVVRGTADGDYIMVSPKVFETFTKIPIILYYCDNIPEKPIGHPEVEVWTVRLKLARLWAAAVNKRGGDVTVVHLPEIGIKGNTHFPMSDLNNIQIADLMSDWLHKKGLD
jgi:hypothetical protein